MQAMSARSHLLRPLLRRHQTRRQLIRPTRRQVELQTRLRVIAEQPPVAAQEDRASSLIFSLDIG